jgi:hypothetical protein
MGVNERGRDRTFNQWLKRPTASIRFSHPMVCYFYPVHWTDSKTSTLDAFIKVESTRKRPMDLLLIDRVKDHQLRIIVPLDGGVII